MSAGAGAQTLSYPSTQLPGHGGIQRAMQTVRVTR